MTQHEQAVLFTAEGLVLSPAWRLTRGDQVRRSERTQGRALRESGAAGALPAAAPPRGRLPWLGDPDGAHRRDEGGCTQEEASLSADETRPFVTTWTGLETLVHSDTSGQERPRPTWPHWFVGHEAEGNEDTETPGHGQSLSGEWRSEGVGEGWETRDGDTSPW